MFFVATTTDTFPQLMLALALAMGAALVGRWIAGRLFQPTVLGEIGAGIVIGNVGVWLGIPLIVLATNLSDVLPMQQLMFEENVSLTVAQRHVAAGDAERLERMDELVDVLSGEDGPTYLALSRGISVASDLGLVVLFFMMGLRASIGQLRASGLRTARVSLLGLVVPLGLVALVSSWLLPDSPLVNHLFLGVLFVESGIGLPARIFDDAGRGDSPEVQIVLGAALYNQILEMILIAVFASLAATGTISLGQVASVAGLAVVYLAAVTLFGERFTSWLAPVFQRLDRRNGKVIFCLGLTFVMAWLATRAGLVAFMGAFAAGLILNEGQFGDDGKARIADLMAPLESMLVPVFFVTVGMQVSLGAFAETSALVMALVFAVVGLGSKLVAGLGAGRDRSRMTVGLGLMARGGTLLIFAHMGQLYGLLDEDVYAPLAIFVLVSTLACGSSLQWAVRRLPPSSNAASG